MKRTGLLQQLSDAEGGRGAGMQVLLYWLM